MRTSDAITGVQEDTDGWSMATWSGGLVKIQPAFPLNGTVSLQSLDNPADLRPDEVLCTFFAKILAYLILDAQYILAGWINHITDVVPTEVWSWI